MEDFIERVGNGVSTCHVEKESMWTRLQIPTPKPSEGDHCDENEKAICNEMLTLPSHLAWSCILVVSGYPRFIRALTCKVIYGSSSYTIN